MLFVIIPFLMIFGLISLFMIRLIYLDKTVLILVIVSLAFVLLAFLFILFYLGRSLTKPLHELTLISEAVSRGNLDIRIPVSQAQDEIGAMTRSLRHMAEQFRFHSVLQDKLRELLDIYTRLNNALYEEDSIKNIFKEVIRVVCDHFGAYRSSLVYLEDGGLRVQASYTAEEGLSEESRTFPHHDQARALLNNRKYIYLNHNLMVTQKIAFAGPDTTSLCLLLLRSGQTRKGYIILEGKDENFLADDQALTFIADTIAYILGRKEAYTAKSGQGEAVKESDQAGKEKSAPEVKKEKTAVIETVTPDTDKNLEAARLINGLDVDKGITLLGGGGGASEQYMNLLRISAKVFAEGAAKMRGMYTQDLPAFAIEVHGIKGALYNIGADSLGDLAKKLELAAKAGEADYCRDEYPDFEKQLGSMFTAMGNLPAPEKEDRGKGDIGELFIVLAEALEACKKYDSGRAAELITPLLEYSFEDSAGIHASLQKIMDALENIEYEETQSRIKALLDHLMDPGKTV
jgi:HAMP domain-containing protein/HPt (histidine-containing phosphotransfer) domain-containing protein